MRRLTDGKGMEGLKKERIKKEHMKIDEQERRALIHMRRQVMLVRRLGEQLRHETPGALPSLRMDGMPRGNGGVPGGLDVGLAKRDALERLLAHESAELRRMESEARRVMDRMGPELYAFCALYYIAGLSLEETSEALDRCIRQCRRYKQEIEQEDGMA